MFAALCFPAVLALPTSRSAAASTSSLALRGGTDADMAPPIDYLTQVLAPSLKRLLGLTSLQVSAEGRHPILLPTLALMRGACC